MKQQQIDDMLQCCVGKIVQNQTTVIYRDRGSSRYTCEYESRRYMGAIENSIPTQTVQNRVFCISIAAVCLFRNVVAYSLVCCI